MATTSTIRTAGEFIAREVAWHGHARLSWIADRLARAGYDVAAEDVARFGVEAGYLSEVPRLGGYVVTRRINAAVFGRRFAEWVAA